MFVVVAYLLTVIFVSHTIKIFLDKTFISLLLACSSWLYVLYLIFLIIMMFISFNLEIRADYTLVILVKALLFRINVLASKNVTFSSFTPPFAFKCWFTYITFVRSIISLTSLVAQLLTSYSSTFVIWSPFFTANCFPLLVLVNIKSTKLLFRRFKFNITLFKHIFVF